MNIIKNSILSFGVLALSSSLSAATIYVDSFYAQEDSTGSVEKPFSSIKSALESASENDEIILREGIYRESVLVDKSLSLKAAEGEYVLISGCDVVDIKDCEKKRIDGLDRYKLPYEGEVYDVFINAKAMEISRYPDKVESMQSNKDWLNVELFPKGNEDSVRFLEGTQGDFKDFRDGYYVGSHDERYDKNGKISTYYTLSIPVDKTIGDSLVKLDWDDSSTGAKNPNGHFGSGKGVGYIIGSSAGFDAYNEFFANAYVCYFIFPKGVDEESAKVEYRTRLVGVNVKADNVSFEGINFKATSLYVEADGFSMKNCTMRYLAPFIHAKNPEGNKSPQSFICQWGEVSNGSIGLEVKGDNAVIDSSYFAHSWWSAIRVWGNNSKVTNCYIEDIDWIARRASGIHSWGDNNYIAYNTVKDTGGAGIEAGNAAKSWMGVYATNNIFEYNYIENTTNLLIDQGAFYANQQNGANPHGNCVFRYNVIVNARPPEKLKWGKNTDCVYIDNNTSGYIVHSNIMINASEAMHYNDFAKNIDAVGKDIYFLNNSVYNVDYAFAYGLQNHILNDINAKLVAKGEPKQKKIKETNARNLVLMNNVAADAKAGFKNAKVEATPLWQSNYIIKKSEFKDPDNNDLTLSEEALKNPATKIDFAYVLKYAKECADIDYVGAINPKKGMWEYGSKLEVPDFSKDKTLLLKPLAVK